jgi:protein-tyrosine phosphatase
MEEALAMARMAVEAGTRVIVATPHWDASAAAPSREFLEERVAQLQQAIDDAGIHLRIIPGAEVALTPSLLTVAKGRPLPHLARSDYLLVEMLPYTDWDSARTVMFDLQLRGSKILLAHPERAGPVHEKYERVHELKAAGVLLQVVASSLVGLAGNSVRAVARRLLRDNLADVLASDAHDSRIAPPVLSRVRETVTHLAGGDAFERLTVVGPTEVLGKID